MTSTSVEKYLEEFKSLHGEESWKAEVTRLAIQAIKTNKQTHIDYWRELTKSFDWLDWEALMEMGVESLPDNSEILMADMIKRQMPGIKSQAQYDAVIGALDAIRVVLNGILERQPYQETEGHKALEKAMEAARQATEITDKLIDVPEAATSEASKAFKEAPAEFEEGSIQATLLDELQKLNSMVELSTWYSNTKELRDKVVTQKLRNQLLDSIRSRKNKIDENSH